MICSRTCSRTGTSLRLSILICIVGVREAYSRFSTSAMNCDSRGTVTRLIADAGSQDYASTMKNMGQHILGQRRPGAPEAGTGTELTMNTQHRIGILLGVTAIATAFAASL